MWCLSGVRLLVLWCVWGVFHPWGFIHAQVMTGGAGYALQFTGVSFVSVSRPCGSVNPFDAPSFTLEAWFRMSGDKGALAPNPRADPSDGSQSKARIIGLSWEAGYDLEYDLYQDQFLFQTQGLGFADGPGNPPTPNCWASQSQTFPLDQLRGVWHHIAATWDGLTNTKMIYLDGQVIFNATCPGAVLSITSRTLYVGGAFIQQGQTVKANSPFYGEIDEARVWRVARTQQQIQDYMHRSIPPIDFPQMLTYLRFDEGMGLTSADMAHSDNEFLALSATFGLGELAWAPQFVPSTAPLVVNGTTPVQIIRTAMTSQPPTLLNLAYIDPMTQQYMILDGLHGATVTIGGISDARYLSYMQCRSNTGISTPASLNQTCTQVAVTSIPTILPNTTTNRTGTDPHKTPTIWMDYIITIGNTRSKSNTLRMELIQNVPPSTGSSGYALYCDGVNDYGYVNGFQWNTSNAVTVELWVLTYIEQVQGSAVFSVGNSEVVGQWCYDSPHGEPTRCRGRFMAHVPWKDRKLGWHYGWVPGVRGTVQVDITPRLGQWTHVALTSEGRNGIATNGTMRAYANGELIGEYPADGPVGDEPFKGLLICDYSYSGHIPHRGYIDDFRLWNRVLSQAEIKSRMYGYNDIGRGKPPPPGLMVAYDFDEDPILAAGYAEDISGNGYTLEFGRCSSVETIPATNYHHGIRQCAPGMPLQLPDSYPTRVIDAALTPYTGDQFQWDQFIPLHQSQIIITLNGSDANGDHMAAQIISLPTHGMLSHRNGTLITTNEWIWQDPSSQRIDIYFNTSSQQGAGGYPYAMFTYVLTDGLLTSQPAVVGVHVPCDAGTYLDNIAKSCIPCAAGTYQSNQTFSESCVLVPIGTYQRFMGQSSYFICTNQTFSDGMGSISCKSCQDHDYPAPYCTLSSNVQPRAVKGIVAASAILIAVVLIILCLVLRYRRSRVIFSSSTLLTSLMLLGCMGVLISVILIVLPQTSSLCCAKQWVFHLSMDFTILSLLAKTYRLDSIFNSSVLDSSSEKLSDKRFMVYIICYMCYDIIILAIWNGNDPLTINNMDERTCISRHELMYQLLIFIPKVICVIFLLIEAYRIRTIPSIYNNTRGLYVSMCTVLVISLIVILMTTTASMSYRIEKLVISIGMMIGVCMILIALMGPKLQQLQQERTEGLASISYMGPTQKSMEKQTQHNNTTKPLPGSMDISKTRFSVPGRGAGHSGSISLTHVETCDIFLQHPTAEALQAEMMACEKRYRQLDVAVTHATEKRNGLIQQAKEMANRIHVLHMEEKYQHAQGKNKQHNEEISPTTTTTTTNTTIKPSPATDNKTLDPKYADPNMGKSLVHAYDISMVPVVCQLSPLSPAAPTPVGELESSHGVLLHHGHRSSIMTGDDKMDMGTGIPEQPTPTPPKHTQPRQHTPHQPPQLQPEHPQESQQQEHFTVTFH